MHQAERQPIYELFEDHSFDDEQIVARGMISGDIEEVRYALIIATRPKWFVERMRAERAAARKAETAH